MNHLEAIPLELRQANDFVDKLHRHHDPVYRDKFRIGCKFNDKLVDVLEALSIYCDEHTDSYPIGCFNCPFYITDIECSCLIAKSGFDSPCNWAVYKDEDVDNKDS